MDHDQCKADWNRYYVAHKPVSLEECEKSPIDILFNRYGENMKFHAEMKKYHKNLSDVMESFSYQLDDKVVDAIMALVCVYQKDAFEEGLKIGFRLCVDLLA